MQAPAVLAVLQTARSQGLLDDLDAIVSDNRGMPPALEHLPAVAAAASAGSGEDSALDRAVHSSGAGNVDHGPPNSVGGSGGGSGSGEDNVGLRVPLEMLLAAMVSREEALRLDVLQLVTCNPRITSLPGGCDNFTQRS